MRSSLEHHMISWDAKKGSLLNAKDSRKYCFSLEFCCTFGFRRIKSFWLFLSYVTCWAKSCTSILKQIKLRTDIILATFDLATEQISKQSVVQLWKYSLKCMQHTQNYFSCKCGFWCCYVVPYAICVTCLLLRVYERLSNGMNSICVASHRTLSSH